MKLSKVIRMSKEEIDNHVAGCTRCKHADEIYKLCPIGMVWLEQGMSDLLKLIETPSPNSPLAIRMIRDS